MAMLKSKVKSFVTRLQRDKGHDEVEKTPEIHVMQPPDLPRTREDPRKTDEIISEVDEQYFQEGDTDCSEHELQMLGPEIDVAALEERIFLLKTQDNAIYRKIYDLVFANYTAYVQELENVTMLQLSLQEASRTCVSGRRQLKYAREGVSHGGLGLLTKHRKRERLRTLLDMLKNLKTLQRTDAKLKELLEEGDYPAATQLCLECQNAIETYKHFTCVNLKAKGKLASFPSYSQSFSPGEAWEELAVSLQDIQTDIERELEDALTKVCMKFDAHCYDQVQEAYRILGKTQTAVDTLLMKLTTTIHDTAYAVVAEYVKMGDAVSLEDAQQLKMPYMNLCKLISTEHFFSCLTEICKTLWKIMYNYHQIKLWHEQYDSKSTAARIDREDAEVAFNRNYVRQKLEHGLLRVWRDVQQKVRPYLLGIDMSHFKYDDFIRVLGIVKSLISVGVEFCGEGSDSLQDSMRQQSLKYFRNYHRARLDELKIFLETEAWEPCPVRPSFTIRKLREFRFMRTPSLSTVGSPKTTSPVRADESSLFTRFSADDNPFVEQEEEEEGEDLMDTGGLEDTMSDDDRNDDEDDPDELKQDYVDEQTGESGLTLKPPVSHYRRQRSTSAPKGPVLANTTLTVIRFFVRAPSPSLHRGEPGHKTAEVRGHNLLTVSPHGNYMQMMSVLQPIAFDVLECLSQLFDYYLYAVQEFFASDLMDLVQEDIQLSSKLTISLKRITETLIFTPQEVGTNSVVQMSDGSVKVCKPAVNFVVDLGNPNTLYGLRYRMVAIESLVFLASQFECLMPYFERLIPESKRSFLTQFFSHTVKTAQELRNPVYCGVATKALPYDQVLQSMSSVKWDVREIMSQHSAYVDLLVQEFSKFKDCQTAINSSVPIPSEAYHLLWERAITLANRTFVEGFAQAKKCSNEGRALMHLDYQQYRTKVERMSELRPLPNHSFVEDYIRAYYLSECDTEDWLRKHQEYSLKQLQALVQSGVGTRINKKSRQKLFAIIEERDRLR